MLFPCRAVVGDIGFNHSSNPADRSVGHLSVDGSYLERAVRAVKVKHYLEIWAYHMDVRRPMVGRIDHDTEALIDDIVGI